MARKVLVIDDDEHVLDMVKIGLEAFDYEVHTAFDENSTLEVLKNIKPDVILMDISLPGVDGVSLCREIKNMPGLSETPIIMLTAFSDSRTFHDSFLFGATDYITKPFDIMEIRDKIEKNMKGGKQ